MFLVLMQLFACLDDVDLDRRLDKDGDGFDAQTTGGEDCDDTDPLVNPGVVEQCDELDNDCNGLVDDEPVDGVLIFTDGDQDGFGGASRKVCSPPSGALDIGGDCDDLDPTTYPNATERCDQLDNDCDGVVDEGLATSVWYVDADGDGYGQSSASSERCSAPPMTSNRSGDCDDSDPNVSPDAQEVWYNGVDEDCDGASDYDQDGDGVDGSDWGGADCVDIDANVAPNVEEVCNNGVDDDCVNDDQPCRISGYVLSDQVSDTSLLVSPEAAGGVFAIPGSDEALIYGEGGWTQIGWDGSQLVDRNHDDFGVYAAAVSEEMNLIYLLQGAGLVCGRDFAGTSSVPEPCISHSGHDAMIPIAASDTGVWVWADGMGNHVSAAQGSLVLPSSDAVVTEVFPGPRPRAIFDLSSGTLGVLAIVQNAGFVELWRWQESTGWVGSGSVPGEFRMASQTAAIDGGSERSLWIAVDSVDTQTTSLFHMKALDTSSVPSSPKLIFSVEGENAGTAHVADVNVDGEMDLIVTPSQSSATLVYLGPSSSWATSEEPFVSLDGPGAGRQTGAPWVSDGEPLLLHAQVESGGTVVRRVPLGAQ